jgi:hypothetical protein
MLNGFKHAKTAAEDAARTVTEYVAALEGMPLWAVAEAARRYRDAEVHREDHTFAPSAPQFRLTVLSVLAPYREERALIRRVLDAEILPEPTEEERRRIHERMQSLAAQVCQGADPLRPKRAEVARSLADASDRLIARQLAALGIDDGLKVSPVLRGRIAQMRKEQETKAKLAETANQA